MGKTLMIFGLGDLGGWVLEFFARRVGLSTIIAADIKEEWGVMKTHCAAAGAGLEGYSKTIKFEKCDVKDTEFTAELINKYKPDVIYSSLTLSAWLPNRVLIKAFGKKYHQASVHGVPTQITLLYKLMEALKRSGHKAPVVNHSYPDVTNCILYRAGYPVTIGAGNLDNVVAEVKRKVSISENVPFTEVIVYLVAEHALNVFGSRGGAPYFLKVLVGDQDITKKTDVDSLLSDKLITSPPDQTSWLNHPFIASSAVRNVMAMINDTNEFACAPGPNGLPGGYPVRISGKGVEVVLPEGITMEQAIKINMDGMRMEGVEEIKNDGTTVITQEGNKVIKELFGMDLKEIRLSDMEDLGKDIAEVKRKLIKKYTQ